MIIIFKKIILYICIFCTVVVCFSCPVFAVGDNVLSREFFLTDSNGIIYQTLNTGCSMLLNDDLSLLFSGSQSTKNKFDIYYEYLSQGNFKTDNYYTFSVSSSFRLKSAPSLIIYIRRSNGRESLLTSLSFYGRSVKILIPSDVVSVRFNLSIFTNNMSDYDGVLLYISVKDEGPKSINEIRHTFTFVFDGLKNVFAVVYENAVLVIGIALFCIGGCIWLFNKMRC